MRKLFLILTAFCLLALPVVSIDWPQDEVASDSFYSYFGQLRGGTISSSLVFASPSDIKAVNDGELLIILGDYADDTGFFPSTLGTAVILAHDDGLLTVYGNIDGETLPDKIWSSTEIKTGTVFGTSGNSAWQQGRSSLEFQVVDYKNGTSLNPRILMPRVGNELPLSIGAVTFENRNGVRYNLLLERNLPSGTYKVYKERQKVAVPYKTRISINGTAVDEIRYDILTQNKNELCVNGKSPYPLSVLYPNDTLQLLGEASLTPGRNILGISLTNILGEEIQSSWSLTVN